MFEQPKKIINVKIMKFFFCLEDDGLSFLS